MSSNSFATAWGTMLLAALLVLLFPLFYPLLGGLAEPWRSYDFASAFLLSDEAADTTVAVDSSALLGLAPVPPAYSGKQYLSSFYQSLAQDTGQIRIAHIGDSAIEGDLITQSLRDSLQRRFGGSGVGLLPLSSHIQTFRRSVRHRTSEGWYRLMLGRSNEKMYPLGIMGGYFLSRPPAVIADSLPATDSLSLDTVSLTVAAPDTLPKVWVSYGGVSLYPGLQQLPGVRLFYTHPIPDSTEMVKAGRVTANAGEWQAEYRLDGRQTVNQQWITKEPVRRIRLNFELSPKQPLFAVSAESPQGLIVDNIPSRGNSGGRLTQIPWQRLQAFDEMLDYELIILQFGLNALAPELEDFTWYRNEIERTIRHIKRAFPEKAILLIGPTDRGIKDGAAFRSDPSVPRVTAVMREVAEAEQIAFFSFYEAMGGDNSMIEWVEQRSPRWANLDYTHLSFTGAEEAGDLLLDFLLSGYEAYLKKEEQAWENDTIQ